MSSVTSACYSSREFKYNDRLCDRRWREQYSAVSDASLTSGMYTTQPHIAWARLVASHAALRPPQLASPLLAQCSGHRPLAGFQMEGQEGSGRSLSHPCACSTLATVVTAIGYIYLGWLFWSTALLTSPACLSPPHSPLPCPPYHSIPMTAQEQTVGSTRPVTITQDTKE